MIGLGSDKKVKTRISILDLPWVDELHQLMQCGGIDVRDLDYPFIKPWSSQNRSSHKNYNDFFSIFWLLSLPTCLGLLHVEVQHPVKNRRAENRIMICLLILIYLPRRQDHLVTRKHWAGRGFEENIRVLLARQERLEIEVTALHWPPLLLFPSHID